MGTNVKIATDIFRQRWFRRLGTDEKCLWFYLLAESNLVGVFEVDADAWNFALSPDIPFGDETAFEAFGSRAVRLPCGKGIVVDKLDYQRNFSRNSAQWKWVEKALAEVGLAYDELQVLREKSGDADAMTPQEARKRASTRSAVETADCADETEDAPTEADSAKSKRFVKPTVEEVAEYCRERSNCVDAQAFCDFYESKGWRIGRNPMKDWHAAVRTWEKRDGGRAGRAANAPSREYTARQNMRREF